MTIPTNQVDNNVDVIKLEGGPRGGEKTIPIKNDVENNVDCPPVL